MSLYKNPNRPFLRIFLLIFALLNVQMSLAFSAAIPLQKSSLHLLKKAENHYHQGEFQQTLQLIRQFLQKNSASDPDKIKAYALLSKTFIAQGNTASAKKIIRKIFTVNPAYHPTLEQEKPSYIKMVEAVRKELKPNARVTSQQKKNNSVLLWAGTGGAAALAILIGVLVSGKNGGSTHTLPKPPDFPTK